MSSWEEMLVPAATRNFEEAVQALLPLSRLSEFHDEAMITEVGVQERRIILEEFMKKISDMSGDKISNLITELDEQVKKVMSEYTTKNKEHREQSEQLIEQVVDFLSREFESCMNSHLKLDPRMDLETLRSLLATEKEEVMSNFRDHWKPGSVDFHHEYGIKLKEKLDGLSESIVEKQREFLEGPAERERRMFEEAKQNLQEICEQFNSDIETGEFHFKTDVSRDLFAKKVEKARTLLNKPDVTLEEIQREQEILLKTSAKYARSK